MTTDRAKDKPAKQTLVEGSERMSGLVRLGGALAVTVLLVFPVQAQSLNPWRHAALEKALQRARGHRRDIVERVEQEVIRAFATANTRWHRAR